MKDVIFDDFFDDFDEVEEDGALKFKGFIFVDIFVFKWIKVVVIIGLNIGGKIVVMKVVGFVVFMVKFGIFIFVERVVILFFDKVFVDIGDD